MIPAKHCENDRYNKESAGQRQEQLAPIVEKCPKAVPDIPNVSLLQLLNDFCGWGLLNVDVDTILFETFDEGSVRLLLRIKLLLGDAALNQLAHRTQEEV